MKRENMKHAADIISQISGFENKVYELEKTERGVVKILELSAGGEYLKADFKIHEGVDAELAKKIVAMVSDYYEEKISSLEKQLESL